MSESEQLLHALRQCGDQLALWISKSPANACLLIEDPVAAMEAATAVRPGPVAARVARPVARTTPGFHGVVRLVFVHGLPLYCFRAGVHCADDRLPAVLDHNPLDPHHLLCFPTLAV